ncbi:MAG: hypothetical protein RMJ98_11130 [Myxococcales bacterium]|nr:hypothetical protein [Polyangiaceae bacterium]MDW8249840.1 hypothetical protein [Myxococcales bacterium]
MTSTKTVALTFLVSALVACTGESFVHTTEGASGTAGAGTGGSGPGGVGSGGTAGGGGSNGGTSGSPAGVGGAHGGNSGTSVGAGGSQAGFGGSEAGSGGSDGGAGGSEAGSGGSGGSEAGSGGSDSGAGGSGIGSGGSDAGSGGSHGGSSGSGGSHGGSGGSSSGSGGSNAGASGSSTAGQGGTGGNAGAGGSSGAGGASSCLAGLSCNTDEYCNAETGTCTPCGNMDRFEFGAPESLLTGKLIKNPGFPRVQLVENQLNLFFQAQSPTDNPSLSQPNPLIFKQTWSTKASALSQEPYCQPTGSDDCGGPLPLPPTIKLDFLGIKIPAPARYVFFDSKRHDGSGNPSESPRRIYVASVNGDDSFYAPILQLNQGANDYSVAFAYAAEQPRFYWIRENSSPSGAKNEAELYTTTTGQNAQPSKVAVQLQNCSNTNAVPEDLAPWVFPDGTHILFHARCNTNEPLKLYYAALNTDGSFQSPAQIIKVETESSGVEFNQLRMPSLSPNRCELLFEVDTQIYRARRR